MKWRQVIEQCGIHRESPPRLFCVTALSTPHLQRLLFPQLQYHHPQHGACLTFEVVPNPNLVTCLHRSLRRRCVVAAPSLRPHIVVVTSSWSLRRVVTSSVTLSLCRSFVVRHFVVVTSSTTPQRRTKERRNEGTKERRNEGTKEQRNEGTKERRNEGTNARTHEGTNARRNEGTNARRNEGTNTQNERVDRCCCWRDTLVRAIKRHDCTSAPAVVLETPNFVALWYYEL